jgi:hypothetical protein
VIDADELRRSVIEDQVAELRQRNAKGEKPPTLPSRAPNDKQEAITGQKSPRLVGLPPGMLETGLEGVGAGEGAKQGAIRGAMWGSRFGPYGTLGGGLFGGLLGGGLGLAGTRAVTEETKAAMGMRPPITADEAIASGQRALMEGVAGEGAFRLLRAVPNSYRGLKQRLLSGEIAPAERAVYDQAQEMGIHLTPSTLTDSKAPKMIESTLRRTLAGSGKFTANDIQNEVNLRKGVEQWADQTMSQYPGKEETGVILKKVLNDEVIPEQTQYVKALYKRLDEQTGGAQIVETGDLY